MNGFELNHDKKIIYITKDFKKKAENPMNDEFEILSKCVNAFPTYTVKTKAVRNDSKKQSLKLADIEQALLDSGNDKLVDEFNDMRKNKVNFFKIKKWFTDLDI